MPCCGNVKCIYCGILIKKLYIEEHQAVCPANPQNKVNEMTEDRYFCTKCKRTHQTDSKIGKNHLKFRGDQPVDEPVSVEEPVTEEDEEETPPEKEIPILQKEDDTFEKLTAAEEVPDLCKYVYWARDSCQACQGHRCAAAADKKLDPGLVTEVCKTTAYLECEYYTEAVRTNLPAICPYQGPPPEGRVCCSGVWCYGNDRTIRVPKSCKKFWVNCDIFARKKWAGKPFYRDLPKIGTETVTEEEIE